MESSLTKQHIRGVDYQVFDRISNESKPLTCIFLHGFAGSHESYSHIFDAIDSEYRIIAPDLLGHGVTDAPRNSKRYQTLEQVADLLELIQVMNAEKPVLIGYSMGARLALQFAVRNPDAISGLVLESGTFGIRNIFDAELRRESDKETASLIQSDFETFLKSWDDNPVFKTPAIIQESHLEKMKLIRHSQKPHGLAASLRGFGTGTMPALFEELNEMKCPALILNGETDLKFTKIGFHLSESIPNARHVIVKDCGHRVHLEAPVSYIETIHDFLAQLNY